MNKHQFWKDSENLEKKCDRQIIKHTAEKISEHKGTTKYIIDNKTKLFDSFRFADVEKIKYKKEPIIFDVDVNNFKINDASQLSLCESKIDKIIIPEQYTKNKTIPSFAFINNDIISEIEIVGDVGQINPNAFIYSAEKIIINGDIKGKVNLCPILLDFQSKLR